MSHQQTVRQRLKRAITNIWHGHRMTWRFWKPIMVLWKRQSCGKAGVYYCLSPGHWWSSWAGKKRWWPGRSAGKTSLGVDIAGITVSGKTLRRDENGWNSRDAWAFCDVSPAGGPEPGVKQGQSCLNRGSRGHYPHGVCEWLQDKKSWNDSPDEHAKTFCNVRGKWGL